MGTGIDQVIYQDSDDSEPCIVAVHHAGEWLQIPAHQAVFMAHELSENAFEMTRIRLTQEAYANGGSVRVGVCELTEWYEAAAEDSEGNIYRVIWRISPDYDPSEQDESNACDWDAPWAVLDDHYNDVSDSVEIDR